MLRAGLERSWYCCKASGTSEHQESLCRALAALCPHGTVPTAWARPQASGSVRSLPHPCPFQESLLFFPLSSGVTQAPCPVPVPQAGLHLHPQVKGLVPAKRAFVLFLPLKRLQMTFFPLPRRKCAPCPFAVRSGLAAQGL